MTITPAQCRGARAMLNWSRAELADAAGIGERTLIDFERGARRQNYSTLAVIRRALEDAGIRFTEYGIEPLDRPMTDARRDRLIAALHQEILAETMSWNSGQAQAFASQVIDSYTAIAMKEGASDVPARVEQLIAGRDWLGGVVS